MRMAIRFVIINGPDLGRTYELAAGSSLMIGR
jgi:hypothetical protein